MSMPADRCCISCYYCDLETEQTRGTCRRHAPTTARKWPTILATNWCGEFRDAGTELTKWRKQLKELLLKEYGTVKEQA